VSPAREDIHAELASLRTVSTHSHHLPDAQHANMDLAAVLSMSYVSWCGVPVGSTPETRRAYLDQVRHKSYFVWLERSLRKLYDFRERITPENWEELSSRVKSAHAADPERHLHLLGRDCAYSSVLLDCYWEPGSDNGHSPLFRPSFRIDPFLHSWDPGFVNKDGTSLAGLYAMEPFDSPAALEAALRAKIAERKAAGCVALKSAIAYERDIAFRAVPEERAARALRAGKDATEVERRELQDWTFHAACRAAAEFGLPFQVHTGLGQLVGTRAIKLRETVAAHPETRFVLFHCSFPWTEDILALLHNFRNVYPDLCWLPLLSTEAAKRALRGLIEVGTADKVAWGCDTWTGEESHGALLAARHVVAEVLGDMVRGDWMDLEAAKRLGRRIMHDNAAALYGVE
jgi:hypothetical protein